MPHMRITTAPVASMPGASRHDSGGVHCDAPHAIGAGFGGCVGFDGAAAIGGGAAIFAGADSGDVTSA